MKRIIFIAMLVMAFLLAACGSGSTPIVIPTISLDNSNSSSNTQSDAGNNVAASGVVVPLNEARLAFASSGKVTEVTVKVGDRVKAGDILVRLDTTILEAKVREAQASLEAAQAQVRFLKRAKTDAVHLETAQADVDRAQALVDLANATLLAQSSLAAPFDGTIVSVDISPAETVIPGRVVILLGDLSHYQVETTDLSERDVSKVKVGQSVMVFIEALDQEVSGSVSDISLVSSTLGGDVIYTVTIELDKQPQGLRWGMSADVEIQMGE